MSLRFTLGRWFYFCWSVYDYDLLRDTFWLGVEIRFRLPWDKRIPGQLARGIRIETGVLPAKYIVDDL